MKKLIVALVVSCTALIQAQNTVSGRITDTNNKALSGVSIYIQELQKGTTSQADGTYNLSNLPKGTVRISFALVGFGTQYKTVSEIQKQNTINIQLAPSVFEMDEVIVSTAFNKLQSQNVMKVAHETMKNLSRKGTSTLIEGLATIPGVSQVSTGASIGKPVIRGLSGNRVLVYSQGVRVENQQFGDEHGLGLNDAGVESVEVIKGPASLLYGSDALGGVLYFNPEKFANANTYKVNFSQKLFANTLGSNSSLGLKTTSDNWKFLARGTMNTHSDYTTADGERVTNTRYQEKDFKTGIGYSDASFSSVLRYNFNDLTLGIPEEGIAEQSQSKSVLYPKQAVSNHLVSLNSSLFFNSSKLDLDLGFISNDRSEFEDSEVAVLKMKLNTFNYNAKYYLPSSTKMQTILGVQGMHQTNENSGEEYLIPDAVTQDFGVFGTTNYEWNSNVIQAGLRFDTRNLTSEANGILGEEGSFEALKKSYTSWNASLGYKTNLNDAFIFRFNLASGFRAPNLAELSSNGVHEGTNRYEVGNANLKTEQNFQTDLNLEYKTDHLEFFVNGFYNHINDFIYINPSGESIDDNEVFNYVQNNAALFGGEIGLHFHPHPLDWLHLETSFETVTGKKQNGDYLPLIPANNWNNTLRTEWKDTDWLKEGFATISLVSTFNQNKISGFETRTAGYSILNLGIGGTLHLGKTKMEVNLNGNNITDKKYTAHLSRLKTDGISNMGRNWVVGLNFNL
ncbi:TonB-dependent receptor [Flavobacterium ammoniigenes]|jgi:iron complex outermembrane receptor protein|uniref:TonB-dependent receptor n=1 Tax=Flavobacterium ammoniigenes TaxID=1751095 RepID=A0ABM7V4I9_9FLAO|nr:TonB-dependent receptor [Flavobacterium ammoniigenes]BDB54454.1 TonB-dependent receptor [Flavobacterium ammoniigenes]